MYPKWNNRRMVNNLIGGFAVGNVDRAPPITIFIGYLTMPVFRSQPKNSIVLNNVIGQLDRSLDRDEKTHVADISYNPLKSIKHIKQDKA